jgi:hypothetical protein
MNNRPDPDALLAGVQAEEAGPVQGRLKIFFGATAGVGKTYAMLEAAHVQRHICDTHDSFGVLFGKTRIANPRAIEHIDWAGAKHVKLLGRLHNDRSVLVDPDPQILLPVIGARWNRLPR